ncbi:MAG: elongation factor P [Anaeroplasmataceae bacterium]|nr:elongation factor P [Anaeroplasmataceae bacterium]MDE6013953.1 elongation factor P [Anaeroplasmataceae bacterium]
MVNTNDLKNGMVIEYDGKLMQILEFMHVLQNKVAYVRVKMKDLRTGTVTETALKGSDSAFKRCYIERKEMQYIYNTGTALAFMDMETYEQIEIPLERLAWEMKFITDGANVSITIYEGEILGVSLPDKVTLKIVDTTPAVKGSATDRKKATLETGLEITVPAFLDIDTEVIVSTIDGSYVSRA